MEIFLPKIGTSVQFYSNLYPMYISSVKVSWMVNTCLFILYTHYNSPISGWFIAISLPKACSTSISAGATSSRNFRPSDALPPQALSNARNAK